VPASPKKKQECLLIGASGKNVGGPAKIELHDLFYLSGTGEGTISAGNRRGEKSLPDEHSRQMGKKK